MKRFKSIHLMMLGLTAMCLVACADQAKIGQGKGQAHDATLVDSRAPMAQPLRPILEKQTEIHTCGLVAMNMLYVSYGLDPAAKNLRMRLGVDQPAVFWDDQSTGVLPQDMLSVLKEDGFYYEVVDLQRPAGKTRPLEHFAEGHHALMIYRFPGTFFYHWVVLDGNGEGELDVYDPWVGGVASTWEKEYQTRALSLILVKKATPELEERMSWANPDWDGTMEMLNILGREMVVGE